MTDATITIEIDSAALAALLEHVDAPETSQPFATRSKQALSLLVYGKTVRAVCPYRSYNRYVCDVTADGRDVQAELVKACMVWVSKKYNKRPELWTYLKRARAGKKGIWALPAAQRITPKDWRHRHKSRQKTDRRTVSIEETP